MIFIKCVFYFISILLIKYILNILYIQIESIWLACKMIFYLNVNIKRNMSILTKLFTFVRKSTLKKKLSLSLLVEVKRKLFFLISSTSYIGI